MTHHLAPATVIAKGRLWTPAVNAVAAAVRARLS
jgi:hypothetical protein